MYIRDRSMFIVEPWATHALTHPKKETCPLSTTLCIRFHKKLNKFKCYQLCVLLSFQDNVIMPYFIKYFKNCNTFDIYDICIIQKRTKR